jgi:hypothetical protein
MLQPKGNERTFLWRNDQERHDNFSSARMHTQQKTLNYPKSLFRTLFGKNFKIHAGSVTELQLTLKSRGRTHHGNQGSPHLSSSVLNNFRKSVSGRTAVLSAMASVGVYRQS